MDIQVNEPPPDAGPTKGAGGGRWRLLALAAPLLLTLGVAAVLARPLAPCKDQCDIVERIDEELARVDPQLIVIGNSSARHAVNPAALAVGLGLDPARVVVLGTPSATPGTWYAMLAHRVFGQGRRPEQIVVLAQSGAYWVTRPNDGPDLDTQVAIAGSEDPVLLRVGEIWAGPPRWVYRGNLRLRSLRQTVVQAALGNGAAIAALWNDPLAGEFVVDIADRTHTRFVGINTEGLRLASDAASTFVPDLVTLAHAHDARITFARIPPRVRDARIPTQVRAQGDFAEARPGADAELAEWLAAHGSAYHTLPHLQIPSGAYEDRFHLRPVGAVLYTNALIQAMTGASP